MKNNMLAILSAFAMVWGGVLMRNSLAQTASETPVEHGDMDSHHHMGAPSDGAFHRRFDDADKWAREFDNPERDAWQMPEAVLDALHLQRASSVADIGAGAGYFSVRIARRIPDGKVLAETRRSRC